MRLIGVYAARYRTIAHTRLVPLPRPLLELDSRSIAANASSRSSARLSLRTPASISSSAPDLVQRRKNCKTYPVSARGDSKGPLDVLYGLQDPHQEKANGMNALAANCQFCWSGEDRPVSFQ